MTSWSINNAQALVRNWTDKPEEPVYLNMQQKIRRCIGDAKVCDSTRARNFRNFSISYEDPIHSYDLNMNVLHQQKIRFSLLSAFACPGLDESRLEHELFNVTAVPISTA